METGKEGTLDYIFFEKTMSSKWETPVNAASSEENKVTWLSNDLIRRLLRISENLLTREFEATVNGYD